MASFGDALEKSSSQKLYMYMKVLCTALDPIGPIWSALVISHTATYLPVCCDFSLLPVATATANDEGRENDVTAWINDARCCYENCMPGCFQQCINTRSSLLLEEQFV